MPFSISKIGVGLLAISFVSCMTVVAASCARRGSVDGMGHDPSVLTIKGSDTMVHLVCAWAESYGQQHPETEISVTGGGSGTGFAALLNGTTDVCAASRDMMPKEHEVAASKGIVPCSTLVARDGIAIVVNPVNQVTSLTLDQVRKIFTGAYDNWRQVGGADRKIVVFSRDTSSGTFVFFQEHILRKHDFRSDARLLPSTSTIVQAVAEDDDAIGYVGLGYAGEAGGSIQCLALQSSEQAPAVKPSSESVRLGDYAIARPLRLFTAGEPSGLAKSFVEFCLSTEGQEIVSRSGYVTAD